MTNHTGTTPQRSTTWRVIVTGSRDWPDPTPVYRELDRRLADHGTLTVVAGASGNVDLTALQWAADARARGLPVTPEPHLAEWGAYGRSAGPLRNQKMVDDGADECLAFIGPCTRPRCPQPHPHDSHGTSDCADRAERAGIPTTRYRCCDAS